MFAGGNTGVPRVIRNVGVPFLLIGFQCGAFEDSAAFAGDCAVLGAGTRIISGTATLDASYFTPPGKICLDGRTELNVSSDTIAADGKIDLYTRLFFDLSRTDHVNSVNFLDTTISAAAGPGSDFLQVHPFPIGSTIGAMRINLIDAKIGANRAITLVEESGNRQFQNVYVASLSSTPVTYESFTLTNPTTFSIGAYNITGQNFETQTHLTLKDSTVTNAKLVGVFSGSELTLDNSALNTQIFSLKGILSGNGTINGKSGGADAVFLAGSGANFSPGQSIGTLTINGSLAMQGATGLVSELDPTATPNADLLSVSGAVTGADKLTVTLERDSGYSGSGSAEITDFTGSTYVVLNGASIDSDSVSLVEGNSLNAHLSASLVGTPSTSNQVEVQFTDNSATPTFLPSKIMSLQSGKTVSLSTPWVALTSAVSATHHGTVVNGSSGGTGGGGQTLAGGSTLSTAWLALTNSQVGQLNQVHAEPYSSNLTVGLEQLDHVATTVMNRISAGHDVLERGHKVRDDEGRAIWMDTSAVFGHVEGENGLGTFDYSLANVIVGADFMASDAGSLGGFAGYGHHAMGEHDSVDQRFSAHTGYAGLYGTMTTGAWVFSASGGYGFSLNSAVRNNPDVGLFTGGRAEADFSSHAVFVAGKAGYSFPATPMLQLMPFVSGSYAHVWQGRANEKGGGDFSYDIHSATADAFITGLGFDWSADILYVDPARARLFGFARYDHDWSAASKSAHSVRVSSDLFGTFNQTGQNRGIYSVSAGVGLSGSMSEQASWRIGAAGTLNEHGEEIGAAAHITWRF
ncbi:autotransporter outer membrane beta-barrel domain-containing protein [Roseibium sp.]|uniref:autotransporter family protein n=1 Tax=Roseibium sp. TaxID=1936156 RepID=UPI003A9793FC